MSSNNSLHSLLNNYRSRVEESIEKNNSLIAAPSKLLDACVYALSTGGKRFRPILVYMVAKALEKEVDVSDAALAVEYFHTASLIADDLPSMDNDDERRNKPSTHKVFGEATALLASYALIASGYEAIARGALKNPFNNNLLCPLALENATQNTGGWGATGGQFLDINPPDLSLETILEIIRKKTVSLFEISFVQGWLFGGGEAKLLPLVKKASAHFGLAFQIADDIDDIDQDIENKRSVNTATLFGVEKAKKMVKDELSLFYLIMEELGVNYDEFKLLGETLSHQAN